MIVSRLKRSFRRLPLSSLPLPNHRVASDRMLPASFEEVDVTVLKWIAAEAQRMSQRFILT